MKKQRVVNNERRVMSNEGRVVSDQRAYSPQLAAFSLSVLLFTLCFSIFNFSSAQDLGAKLPFVTAGTTLSWMPTGDDVEFSLPEKAWVKLSIYSPSLDLLEVGDEQYSGNLESSFRFSDSAGVIREETFQLATSTWLTFYEGPLEASRYVLRSDVVGKGKNVYLLKLESSLPEIPLQGYSTTINVSSFEYHDAFTFELHQNAPCALELYDGDGATELEARLIQPTGFIQPMTVSEDLSSIVQNLPRLQGIYTVQLRLVYGAYQKTNSVRFSLLCNGEPQLVTLVPPVFVAPQVNPIMVEVIDTAGNMLSIPYTVSDEFERNVTLDEHPEYKLVEVRTEGGTQIAERVVRFGVEGGKVTYVLEKITPQVEVPLPKPQVMLLPVQPLPLPEVDVLLPESPRLALTRTVSQNELLPCQALAITFRVRNDGTVSSLYVLREILPMGFALVDHGGAMVDESGILTWQGEVAAGAEVVHEYRLEVVSQEAFEGSFHALLESGQEPLEDQASVFVNTPSLKLSRIQPQGRMYVGDEITFNLEVENPLHQDITLPLTPASARLTLLESPEMITVAAQSIATVTIRARLDEAGVAVLQFTPNCLNPVSWREEALALPELPAPNQSTTVTIDMAAYQLPQIDALVLVQKLPLGVSYVSGSTRVNQQVVADPMQAMADDGSYLVFEIPERSIATLSFTVLHQEAYKAQTSDSTLIALTPKPEVLLGNIEALRYYQEAVPIDMQVAARERNGSIILSPADKTVIREGSTTGIVVDTPLDHLIKLIVNDREVPESQIAKKTLDSGINRQTFEYLGIVLQDGANTVGLESTNASGQVFTETITLYLAGVPELVNFEPLTPLVTQSAAPLEFEVTVEDAWGNAPVDSFVTLEITGATPSARDANPEQAGYQVAFVNGHGLLTLEPVAEPGDIIITALIGRELGTTTFTVDSNLRPWIMNGYGSAGAHYHPGTGDFKFGVGARVFAKGRIFNDYLLTLAANYPLDPLGNFVGNPSRRFDMFPVTGSSGSVTEEAFSQYGVYARLERNQSYVQFGDFNTQLEGYLLALSRAYTGLSFQYQPSEQGLGLRGYATYASPSDRVTDLYIPSDGTRDYVLPDGNIKLDTMQLEIVKGDCDVPRDFVEDNDPLLGKLNQGIDYVLDREGILRLNNRLPLADALGNCYYLRANYQLEPGSSTSRVWQYGVQASYRFGIATARAGFYQENLLNDAYARVIAAGLALESENLKGDIEIAYGQNQNDGGIAATLQVAYKASNLSTQATYRYFADGYRSAVIDDASSSGHDLKLNAGYALTPNFILSADTQWRYYAEDKTSQFQTSFLAMYGIPSELRLGETYLARDPMLQFGVQFDKPTIGEAGFRLVAGATASDVFGLEGTEVGVTHRQGLGTTSTTDFSVAYRLFENLSLRVTDRVVWGQSNSLLLGLESSFKNCDALGIFTSVCLNNTLDLGKTKAHVQYELTGGIDGAAGRVLLGVDTEIPLSKEITLNGGISQRLDFSDSSQNETALSLGAVYDRPQEVQAEIAYDLRFGVSVKQVLFVSSNVAINDRAFGNVTIDYLNDAELDPKYGLKFAVAGAYRGDRLSMLTTSALRLGQFSNYEGAEFGGDTRLNFALDTTWSLRSGYLFDYEETRGYRDLISLGLSADLWTGGSLTGYARLYHDWNNAIWSVGGTLEASQALGCGVYGVAGYNLLDGAGANDAAVFGESGVFLRLDIVFDEQWTCGSGSISGQTFLDANADGIRSDDESGVAGITVKLLSENSNLVQTVYTGSDGSYGFANVRSGRYIVQIVLPEHYKFSPIYQGEDKTRDSDIQSSSSQTNTLDLGWSHALSSIDIGIVPINGGR